MKRLLIGVIASVLVCLFIGDAAATNKVYTGSVSFTTKTRKFVKTLGPTAAYGDPYINLYGVEKIRLLVDCMSEAGPLFNTDVAWASWVGDSMYLVFWRHDVDNDTTIGADANYKNNYINGNQNRWDSLFTWGPYALDTSFYLSWYADNLDSLWGLGLRGNIALEFRFTEYDSVADTLYYYPETQDTVEFHMTIEALE